MSGVGIAGGGEEGEEADEGSEWGRERAGAGR